MDQNSFHNQQSSVANYFQPTSTHSFVTHDFNPTSYSTSQRNMNTMPIAPTNQVWRSTELGLFYQPENDDNVYQVTCKMILQDFIPSDDNYEHEFFYQCASVNYYITCKLFTHSLIIKVLNKEIYGMDFDINLKYKESISLHQKLNLEQNLKQHILPFYLSQHQIPESETRLDFDGNPNSLHGHVENHVMSTRAVSMIDTENGWSYDDYIPYQDENGNGYTYQSNDF